MKKILGIIVICLILVTGAQAETVRVKVKREVPAEKEYYRVNPRGNLERVREYNQGKTVIKDNWDYKNGTLYKQREVEGEKLPRNNRRK